MKSKDERNRANRPAFFSPRPANNSPGYFFIGELSYRHTLNKDERDNGSFRSISDCSISSHIHPWSQHGVRSDG
jgi:hypothetical protein